MLKNRTISSILRYCKTKPRFLDIVTKTALFQNRTNQGRVIPRPYCIYFWTVAVFNQFLVHRYNIFVDDCWYI